MYHFEKRKKRHHIILDNHHDSFIDPFIQTETPSFEDKITQTLIEFTQNKLPQKFIGNVYALTITDSITFIEDTLSNTQETIPTDLFIKIYQEWLERQHQ